MNREQALPQEAGGTRPEFGTESNRWVVAAILFLFVLLSVAFSLIVPAFETPDEVFHYQFARHLSEGNPLPVQEVGAPGPWEHEGSQAPLYYLTAALFMAPIDQGDHTELAVRNPRANIGDPLFPGNKNFMLYSGVAHRLQGANLALHVGRWLSTALGVVTLLGAYWLALRAFAGQAHAHAARSLPLATLLLVAAIPQFAFISGALTNDSLITAISTLVVAWLAVLVMRPAIEPIRWWEWALLGLMLGIAALSKLQGLGLFVLAALAGLGMTWQRRDWRLPLRAFLPVALPPMLMSGWWYLRNIRLYGDWTAMLPLLTINGQRPDGNSLAGWWLEFRGLRYSFWGLFGWFNLLLPDWVYWLLDGITIIALTGAVVALFALASRTMRDEVDAGARRVLLLAATWVLVSAVLFVYWSLQAIGTQGRLLFPVLSALAVMAVLGLDFWTARLPAWVRTVGMGALLALLLGSSFYALTVLLPNAYSPAAAVSAVPAAAQRVGVTYDAVAVAGTRFELVALELPTDRIQAGDSLPVTLYLRSESTPTADIELFLQLLDEQGQEIANITTHPGWGRRPTTTWQAGALYADPYRLQVTGEIADWSPVRARLYVGFVDPTTADQGNRPLPAFGADGQPMTPYVGAATVLPHSFPTVEALGLTSTSIVFGNVIRVAGLDPAEATIAPGESITVTLLYEATSTPATDYSAFVHLLDETGKRVAGFDQPPAGSRFATGDWRAGDHIAARFPLAPPVNLPPGSYSLWSGLYESDNVAALLPVTQASDMPTGDGRVQIGTLTVSD